MIKLFDEFKNSDKAKDMAKVLSAYSAKKLNIMEVCGTHTMSIFRYGIRDILPDSINLISGPGCPVCVTPQSYIDNAINISKKENTIITTFGDLLRVPGSHSTLIKEKAHGRDIRLIYSPLDSLKIASQNPDKNVVFLSVGFETTTPAAALTVLKAKEEGINNFFILCANKTMPEALKALVKDSDIKVDGYLYPGHVCAIAGTEFYEELALEYKIPGVIAGFEPLDILGSIIMLVKNIYNNNCVLENEYRRVVTRSGNIIAKEKTYEIFKPCTSFWRGIGEIPLSGLKLKEKYSKFDAGSIFDIQYGKSEEPKGCACGDILKGKKTPEECNLFGSTCTPDSPVGACMVSSEGTCAAYYKYSVKIQL